MIRCISCRATFPEVGNYLSHPCHPHPSTAAAWEEIKDEWSNLSDALVDGVLRREDLSIEEAHARLDEISAAVRVIDDLDAEAERLEAELDELDDPFFGDDDPEFFCGNVYIFGAVGSVIVAALAAVGTFLALRFVAGLVR